MKLGQLIDIVMSNIFRKYSACFRGLVPNLGPFWFTNLPQWIERLADFTKNNQRNKFAVFNHCFRNNLKMFAKHCSNI